MDFNDRNKNENSSITPDWNESINESENRSSLMNNDNHSSRFENNSNNNMKGNGKKINLKGIVSTIAAGVIGSALTLTVLPYTGYMKNFTNNVSSPEQVQPVAPVSTVSAKPTVSSSSGSIADTVERVSKAIVGIVNYQQQSNNNYPFGSSGNFGGFGDFGNSNGSSNDNSQPVESGSGSGIIFQKDGNSAYIVTNNHVVEGASKLEISLYNGRKTPATVVGTDALTDLAVLKIDSHYVTDTAQFGNSATLRPGDPVYAIGNPLGLDLSRTVTEGIVSAINRTISVPTSAGNWDTNVIQTDAAINPGNSGGALISDQGLVMGINSLKISQNGVEGLGFAIPSDDAIPIVNQLIKYGKVERPYLGVGLADLNTVPQMYWPNLPNDVTNGVMITNIDPQSVAAKSGFQTKDIIISMNGTQIKSSTDLRKYLYTKVKIGDTVKFGLYRNGKLINIPVKLTAKKAN